MKLYELLLREEIKNARKKFPSNKQMLLSFVEESGEVVKAFLDLQQGKTDTASVQKELIQAACVAIRLLEEGDFDFPEFIELGIEKG